MVLGQKTQEYSYPLRMTEAQNGKLDQLVVKTGRTKADLLREAVNLLLGVYKEVIESQDAGNKSVR